MISTGFSLRALQKYRQLLGFALVGVASNGVYALALMALRLLALPWWAATAGAYALSMVFNYFFQRRVTFASARSHVHAGPRYLVLQGLCLAANSLLMELLVARMGIHPVLGQLAALAMITTVSYVGQRFWVFKTG